MSEPLADGIVPGEQSPEPPPEPKPAIPNRSSRSVNGHSSSIRNGAAERATKCSHIGRDDTRARQRASMGRAANASRGGPTWQLGHQ